MMNIRTLITTLLISVCFVFTAHAETEPNNTSGQANAISFNGSTTGTLDTLDGVDWFRINSIFDVAIVITGIFDDTLMARVELYDMNMNLLDSSFSGTDTLIAGFECAAADSFYIKLVHRGGKGTYTLKTKFNIPLVLLTEFEPNNTSGQYLDFSSGNPSGAVGAHLGYEDRSQTIDVVDWFRFITTKNGQLYLTAIFDSSLTGKLTLYDETLSIKSSSAANSTGKVELVLNCAAPDTFFAKVERNSGCGSYQLIYEIDTPTVAADNEPNDLKNQSIWLPGATTLTGHLGLKDQANNTDQLDWYVLKPQEDGNVTIHVVFDSTITGNLFMINRQNSQVVSPVIGTGKVSMNFPCAGSDSFFVRVYSFSGCGGYSISYDLKSPTAANDNEPNSMLANASQLSNLSGFSGHLGFIDGFAKTDTTDWFKLPITSRVSRFKLTTLLDSGLEVSIVVYDSLLNPLTTTTVGKDTIIRQLSCLQAEGHYIKIKRNNGCGGYIANLETILTTLANDNEPNNTGATAQVITSDTFTGHAGFIENGLNNKFDYFSVMMEPSYGNCFTFTPQIGGQYQLSILDSNGINIPPGYVGQGDTFSASNFKPPYNGRYLLMLENGSSTCTDYTITRTKTLDQIGLVKPTETRCINDFVNLSAIFTNQTPDSMVWELEDAVKIKEFGFNISPKFTSGGWKEVKMTAYNCAGGFTRTDSVYITPVPTPGFTYSISGSVISFTNTSADYDSLAWFFDDGKTSSDTNPTHSYNITAKYNVCLQAFNDCGSEIYCDSVSAIGVGIGSIKLPDYVQVYPNPVNDELTIDLSRSDESIEKIDIYDLSGKRVMQKQVDDNTTRINLGSLPEGIYIVTIHTAKTVYRVKISVE